jgi:glutaryl-CoA dehydrogenase (non-decarboxylating)
LTKDRRDINSFTTHIFVALSSASCLRVGKIIGMDFSLSQEHDLIRESSRKFAQQEIIPGIRERDAAHESDPDFLKKLAASGFTGVSIPAGYGGSDTDYISLGIVCEELERGDTSARVVMSVHSGLHCLTLMQWGTDEQKKRWLPALAKGEKIGAFGLTEPNAGAGDGALPSFASPKIWHSGFLQATTRM